MKTFILGLDGATFDLIRPWANDGKLPNFRELMDKGCWAPMRSTIPPVTAPAWASMYTGLNPGKLGVFFFEREQKGTYEPLVGQAYKYKGRNMWDIIADHGLRSGLVSCVFTYPPYPVNGFMVCDCPIDVPDYTYPSELKEEISGIYKTTSVDFYAATEDEYLRDTFETTRKKIDTTKYLMEQKDWNLFFLTLVGTDTLQHFFFGHMYEEVVGKDKAGKYGDSILRMYQMADEFLGYLKERGINTFVVSDHGGGFWDLGKPARVFYVNRWLESQGLLKEAGGRNTGSILSRLGITPGNVYSLMLKLGIDLKKHVSKETQKRIIKSSASIDYANTKAWLRMNFSNFGGIRINLEGREPAGIVKKDEYEGLRDEIISKLRALEDNGRKVMQNVWKREDIYHGPYVDDAFDIVFELSENFTSLRMMDPKPFGDVKKLSGFHTKDGIFMAFGPDISGRGMMDMVNITDVAPTLLRSFGIPVPDEMDGKPIDRIFKSVRKPDAGKDAGRVADHSGPEGDASGKRREITKEEEEAIRKNLEGLGYI